MVLCWRTSYYNFWQLKTKREYDDMISTDDEMTNKRMGRNVQKYLCLQIRSRERESMIVYQSKIKLSTMESSSPGPDVLLYSVCRDAGKSNPFFFATYIQLLDGISPPSSFVVSRTARSPKFIAVDVHGRIARSLNVFRSLT